MLISCFFCLLFQNKFPGPVVTLPNTQKSKVMKIQSDRPRARYNCRQIELYAICQIAWASCLSNLAAFFARFTFYDAAYIAARQADILAAQALPDFQARNQASEDAALQLNTDGLACIDKTDLLFDYIRRAWPGDLAKPKLEAAGSDYRIDAPADDWESIIQLMTSGQTFITDNSAKLLADGGMPASFAADHLAAQAAFAATYADFTAARQTEYDMTDAKIEANNAIYDQMMQMCSEAQNVFRTNASLRERFVFKNIKQLVTAPGAAGLLGTVTLNATPTPAVGAIVTIVELDRTAITDALGQYQIIGIPSGRYTILITLPGYTDFTKANINIPVGTNHTENATLTPAP